MFCAFIDFEKAFDKVWRDGLWYKLLLNNMNGNIYNIIVNMYSGKSADDSAMSTVSSAYTFTKSFRYIPSWISISLKFVCNPFKLHFVKYDSRSFMNTAKRKGDKFSN
jgi:hypothetical protein